MLEVMEKADEGILLIDVNRNVIASNTAYKTITGWAPKEVTGKNCCDLIYAVTPGGKKICREHCLFDEALKSKKHISDKTVNVLNKKNERFLAQMAHTVIEEKDEVQCLILIKPIAEDMEKIDIIEYNRSLFSQLRKLSRPGSNQRERYRMQQMEHSRELYSHLKEHRPPEVK